MYNYSPISKIYIKNFRNIGEAELDFSQSPIITLLGENEAGKTSVIKAFATCALHANPRDQKDYIRDGTQLFGVAMDLQDGTRVTRVKEATGLNSYQVTKPDGTKWATNKITDGLPAEVQNVIGLIDEPETKEFLHIRTYEDKLLFVITPASTNYKVMYNALKVEQLTKAIKSGSSEVNQLKSKINSNEASISTLSTQARDISIIDVEPLKNVKDRLNNQLAAVDKIDRLKKLVDKVNNCERQLGALGLLDRFGLQPINEVTASKLSTASRLLNNKTSLENCKSRLSEVENLEILDTSMLNKIYNVANKVDILNAKISSAGAISSISQVYEISEILVLQLSKLRTLLNKNKELSTQGNLVELSMCNEISTADIDRLNKLQKIHQGIFNISTKKEEMDRLGVAIGQIQTYLKQCGVAVETCPKCGEAIVFDVDKLN